MSKSMKAVSVWVFGLLVAATLAVGAQTAFAQPVSADCPDNGSSFLGSCIDTPHCQDKCDDVHGEGQSTGICSGTPGCCRCLF